MIYFKILNYVYIKTSNTDYVTKIIYQQYQENNVQV